MGVSPKREPHAQRDPLSQDNKKSICFKRGNLEWRETGPATWQCWPAGDLTDQPIRSPCLASYAPSG
ncbi:MAG: hypothetical protein MRJ68_22535, partial [Nitrospira sp.]|nr:hypothetical protein [Nitrospira sp.]